MEVCLALLDILYIDAGTYINTTQDEVEKSMMIKLASKLMQLNMFNLNCFKNILFFFFPLFFSHQEMLNAKNGFPFMQ